MSSKAEIIGKGEAYRLYRGLRRCRMGRAFRVFAIGDREFWVSVLLISTGDVALPTVAMADAMTDAAAKAAKAVAESDWLGPSEPRGGVAERGGEDGVEDLAGVAGEEGADAAVAGGEGGAAGGQEQGDGHDAKVPDLVLADLPVAKSAPDKLGGEPRVVAPVLRRTLRRLAQHFKLSLFHSEIVPREGPLVERELCFKAPGVVAGVALGTRSYFIWDWQFEAMLDAAAGAAMEVATR